MLEAEAEEERESLFGGSSCDLGVERPEEEADSAFSIVRTTGGELEVGGVGVWVGSLSAMSSQESTGLSCCCC